MLNIEKEWIWKLVSQDKDWTQELLSWKGITLAWVVGSDTRWFGNVTGDNTIHNWDLRVAHIRDRTECKRLIEQNVLKVLRYGLEEEEGRRKLYLFWSRLWRKERAEFKRVKEEEP